MKSIIEQIRRLALAHPDLQSHLEYGPASEDELRQMQERLGRELPATFRAYLLGFAGGLMLGYEMCGIPTEKSRILETEESAISDLVDEARRRKQHYGLGRIYICDNGGDFSFYLDTPQMQNDECPVVMYGPGADGVIVAESVMEFLEKLTKRAAFK